MSVSVDSFTVSLCESCVWADAYGEVLPESDAAPLARLDDCDLAPVRCIHGPGCGGCGHADGDTAYFGRFCDGCDTRYAGNRYDYVAVPRS